MTPKKTNGLHADSKNPANLIVSDANSSHNSKTEYGFSFFISVFPPFLFLHVLTREFSAKNKSQWQDGMEAFWERVDDIARARLDAEDKLHLKAADTLHRELLQELDRYVDSPSLSTCYLLPPNNHRALRGPFFYFVIADSRSLSAL